MDIEIFNSREYFFQEMVNNPASKHVDRTLATKAP